MMRKVCGRRATTRCAASSVVRAASDRKSGVAPALKYSTRHGDQRAESSFRSIEESRSGACGYLQLFQNRIGSPGGRAAFSQSRDDSFEIGLQRLPLLGVRDEAQSFMGKRFGCGVVLKQFT